MKIPIQTVDNGGHMHLNCSDSKYWCLPSDLQYI